MTWKTITEQTQLEEILKAIPKNVLIFKHSYRCSISTAVKNRIESVDFSDKFNIFMIDVVADRPISMYLAETSNVTHQSPQVLLFQDGQCYFHAAHFDISAQAIKDASA